MIEISKTLAVVEKRVILELFSFATLVILIGYRQLSLHAHPIDLDLTLRAL